MTAGRPTDYTPELIEKAREYLTVYDGLPNLAGLSLYIGVARSTVHKWRGEKAEFSDICDELMAKQEQTLINNGLNGEFNPTITKLILTKHGYSDKVDSTHAGPEGKPIEYIERRIVRPAD